MCRWCFPRGFGARLLCILQVVLVGIYTWFRRLFLCSSVGIVRVILTPGFWRHFVCGLGSMYVWFWHQFLCGHGGILCEVLTRGSDWILREVLHTICVWFWWHVVYGLNVWFWWWFTRGSAWNLCVVLVIFCVLTLSYPLFLSSLTHSQVVDICLLIRTPIHMWSNVLFTCSHVSHTHYSRVFRIHLHINTHPDTN